MDIAIISGHKFQEATHAAIVEMAEYHGAIIIIEDGKKKLDHSQFRGYGKPKAMSHMIIEAIREDLYEIEFREKQVVKQSWNTNRQRKLRHYPGRRWIDTRTTNK
jgi:hypothetical protein